jgi:P-type Mg2+ transporter
MPATFFSSDAQNLKGYDDTYIKQGLTDLEVKKNHKLYGLNVIARTKKKNILVAFIGKFANPLVLILLFASLISAFTGEWVNFAVIFTMILISVVLESYQEYQSEEAAEKLRHKVAVKAQVLREGEKKHILVSHITVGDIVLLEIGDIIPADCQVVSSKDLHIDESSLTGESYPVEKTEGAELYMGSSVVNGDATAVVTKIGKSTQFGHIAEKISQRGPETEFEKGIREFGLLVMKITIVLVVFIFIVNLFFKHDLLESFLFALALAVGLTPELLPMIVTVNLSRGALRMAKKGVIVKHLPAIQNFGSIDILCTDKTGTITENKIRLERYENTDTDEDPQVLACAYLNSFYQTNLKSPMDDAVLSHNVAIDKKYKKIDEIPFDFVRKRLSVVLEKDGKTTILTKGAPESMWEALRYYHHDGKIKPITMHLHEKLQRRFGELSKSGFRVLSVAYKDVYDGKKVFTPKDEKELVFMGFTAFLDPPKKEVKEVLLTLHNEGVALKILTGDNELVTKKVLEELDIPVTGILTGKQMNALSDKEFEERVLKANIFARLTPDQKEKIIIALRKAGKVVGYMGDGVNDAISLKAADVGISVENAVDVAKESADIILVNKSLSVLKDGITEGRITFVNTMKYIFMGTGSNFGNMFSVAIGSLFLPFLPMLPIQIILNNLIYDLSQLTLPMDTIDPEDIAKPTRWDTGFIKRFILSFGPVSSVFDITTYLFLLYVLKVSIPVFRTGWFVESLATQSLVIILVRTKRVPFIKSIPSKYVLISAILAPIVGAFISQSFMGKVFGFAVLPAIFWIYLLVVLVLYMILVEQVKKRFYGKS